MSEKRRRNGRLFITPETLICAVDGCDLLGKESGLCHTHYCRKWRYGTTELQTRPLDERIWKFVDKTATCWLWIGTKSHGYGTIRDRGMTIKAHRAMYELLVGPIPIGLTIDHLCRVTNCVNPDHLEPVTQRINNLRGTGVSARNAAKTHCPQGHRYDEINTRIYRGMRYCRACSSMRRR
jgi:hypothetical protein